MSALDAAGGTPIYSINEDFKIFKDRQTDQTSYIITLMENGPFVDGLPIKNGDFPWLC
jgi:hypothetical protein